MINKMKKFLLLLTTGFGSLILAACYGGVASVNEKIKSLKYTDTNSVPIPDLYVELISKSGSFSKNTDNQGIVKFSIPDVQSFNDYCAISSDTDGTNNGGVFQTETNKLDDSDDQLFIMSN